jgi:hypothetical protein
MRSSPAARSGTVAGRRDTRAAWMAALGSEIATRLSSVVRRQNSRPTPSPSGSGCQPFRAGRPPSPSCAGCASGPPRSHRKRVSRTRRSSSSVLGPSGAGKRTFPPGATINSRRSRGCRRPSARRASGSRGRRSVAPISSRCRSLATPSSITARSSSLRSSSARTSSAARASSLRATQTPTTESAASGASTSNPKRSRTRRRKTTASGLPGSPRPASSLPGVRRR